MLRSMRSCKKDLVSKNRKGRGRNRTRQPEKIKLVVFTAWRGGVFLDKTKIGERSSRSLANYNFIFGLERSLIEEKSHVGRWTYKRTSRVHNASLFALCKFSNAQKHENHFLRNLHMFWFVVIVQSLMVQKCREYV